MRLTEIIRRQPDIAGKHASLEDVHNHAAIAKKLGVPVSKVANMGDEELKIILNTIGNHDFAPDSDFDQHELAMGIGVEHEHTQSMLIAKLIAKDHLGELPDYYTRLEKMEKDANAK